MTKAHRKEPKTAVSLLAEFIKKNGIDREGESWQRQVSIQHLMLEGNILALENDLDTLVESARYLAGRWDGFSEVRKRGERIAQCKSCVKFFW